MAFIYGIFMNQNIYDNNFFNEIEMNEPHFHHFMKDAPKKYKVYKIRKKKGGYRTIAHPTPLLKTIQTVTIDRLKCILPIHPNAFAYVKKKGIKDNALIHLKTKYLLKMDFYDFFNSITDEIFFNLLMKKNIYYDKYTLDRLKQTLFWKPIGSNNFILSVGAPSSPFISNAILFPFDEILSQHTILKNIHYSRYADDLTFSGNNKDELLNMILLTKKVLHELFQGKIVVNDLKTKLISPGVNKFVTGITLTPQGNLSIGRKRKRLIFGLIYKYTLHSLTTEECNYLRGLLAFSKHIEPQLIQRLIKKYGIDVINEIENGNWTTKENTIYESF